MTMLRVFWDAAREVDPHAPDEEAVMRYSRLTSWPSCGSTQGCAT
jgi:hypothetical protein